MKASQRLLAIAQDSLRKGHAQLFRDFVQLHSGLLSLLYKLPDALGLAFAGLSLFRGKHFFFALGQFCGLFLHSGNLRVKFRARRDLFLLQSANVFLQFGNLPVDIGGDLFRRPADTFLFSHLSTTPSGKFF